MNMIEKKMVNGANNKTEKETLMEKDSLALTDDELDTVTGGSECKYLTGHHVFVCYECGYSWESALKHARCVKCKSSNISAP